MMGDISDVGNVGRRSDEAPPHDTGNATRDARLVSGTFDAAVGTPQTPQGRPAGHHGETVVDLAGPVLGWPCANCGRPVPQPSGGTRLLRYCQDNDGVCARAAHERTERGGAAGGLTGDVARAWQLVERIEHAAEQLAGSLSSELGVAGVERRIAQAKAEAANCVAAAQEEREAAERQAEAAWREAASARARAEAATREAAEATGRAERAEAAQAEADKACAEAKETAERERAGRIAADSERDRVAGRESELLSALQTARDELVDLHSRLAEAESALETRGVEAETAKRSAEDVRKALKGAQSQLDRLAEEREGLQERLHEQEQQTWNLSRSLMELQGVVSTLTAERDAARAEADRARRRVDELTAAGASGRQAAAMPGAAGTGPQPMPGVQPVSGVQPMPGVQPMSGPQPPHPPALGRQGDGPALPGTGWSGEDPLFGGPGAPGGGHDRPDGVNGFSGRDGGVAGGMGDRRVSGPDQPDWRSPRDPRSGP